MAEMNIEPITVASLRRLIDPAGKAWALLMVDAPDGQTQFLTWGRSAENKVYASDLAEHVADLLCGPGPITVIESFHGKLEAAQNKARVEELEKENAAMQKMIEDMSGPHAGDGGY